MATKKTTKKTATKKATAKKTAKSKEQLIKETIALTDQNIAAIEAKEQGKAKAPKAKAASTRKAKAAAKPKAGTSKTAKASAVKTAKAPRASAINMAVEVLRKAGEPMRAKDMITAMTEQGLWSSPNGRTPHATLYAAIIREISVKGEASRFIKLERGLFGLTKGA